MPMYEYRCGDCEVVSEFLMKMSDPTPKVCPNCGSEGKLSKIMSMTGFQLKGGGWYDQGYDGKSNQKPESKSSEKAGDKKSESTSKSAKPESSSSSETSKPSKKSD
ncbi:MAG: zinc ribbon domain-containing protein [Pseudobacteriovorax sp.]|nr:zinc ribbon domain-containing protein [Pseudobacteriovorax sp.]